MIQKLSLIVIALASAARVSAQTPTYLGALVISRTLFPSLSPAQSLLKNQT